MYYQKHTNVITITTFLYLILIIFVKHPVKLSTCRQESGIGPKNNKPGPVRSRHKSVPGHVVLVSLVEQRFFEKPKTSYGTENLTLKLYIGRKLCEILEKIDNGLREMKTLLPNIENVLSELIRCYACSKKATKFFSEKHVTVPKVKYTKVAKGGPWYVCDVLVRIVGP